MGSRYSTERRQYERARLQNIVIGILNSDEVFTIGLINDISVCGVNFTHEISMTPDATPIHSINLIADNKCLIDLPCASIWHSTVEEHSDFKIKNLQHCGIQFGKLNPDQLFMLKSIINRCTSLGTSGIISNVHLCCS